MSEFKIIITGPMGAGKTTAVRALSETPVVSTDMPSYDQTESNKPTTTVGFDLGSIQVGDDSVVRVYGTPGQARFAFMWESLARNAMGVIILLDASRPSLLDDLAVYLAPFKTMVNRGHAVIAIGRAPSLHEAAILKAINQATLSLPRRIPVLATDVRERANVVILMELLLMQIEIYPIESTPT
jgi:uncharacterized protein